MVEFKSYLLKMYVAVRIGFVSNKVFVQRTFTSMYIYAVYLLVMGTFNKFLIFNEVFMDMIKCR